MFTFRKKEGKYKVLADILRYRQGVSQTRKKLKTETHSQKVEEVSGKDRKDLAGVL